MIPLPRFALLLSPTALLIACSGGSPPTGTDAGVSAFCSNHCTNLIALTTSQSCTLADREAAQNACAEACQSGWSACDANEQTVTSCCDTTGSTASCVTPCYTQAAQNISAKCLAGLAAAASDPALRCADGASILGSTCSSNRSGPDPTLPCTLSCTTPGSSATVGATCTPVDIDAGTFDCTCTAGKGKGTTFTYPFPFVGGQPPGACPEAWGTQLWNACNL